MTNDDMSDRERDELARHPVFVGSGNREYVLRNVYVDVDKTPALLWWTAVDESGDHRFGSMELAGNGKLISS